MDSLELLKTLVSIPSVNPFRLAQSAPAPRTAAQKHPDNAQGEHAQGGSGAFSPSLSVDQGLSADQGSRAAQAEDTQLLGPIGWGTEGQINQYIEELLRQTGFEVTRQLLHPDLTATQDGKTMTIPARWNVLGMKGGRKAKSKNSVLLFGHTDTVDVKQGWQTDPFSITSRRVEGRERWYALGANDMKGGLAAILSACARCTPEDYTLKVAFVVDEEYYSLGGHALCQSDFMSDVALAVVPEIGDGATDIQEQWVGLGRLGRNEFLIEVIGNACHGADAFIRTDSVNAVHEAAKLEVALIAHCEKSKAIFTGPGAEQLDREVMNAAYLSQHSGGDAILSVPDKAHIVFDRTFLPNESPKEELNVLKDLIASLQASGAVDPRARISVHERPRPTPACLPYFFDPAHPLVRQVINSAKGYAKKISLGIGRSVADENRVAALGIPTVILGPVGAGSHTCEEWVDPESVSRLASMFETILRDIRV